MVELAVVLPVVLTVLLGCIDFGLGISAKLQVANAVREGARLSAVSWAGADGDAQVVRRVQQGLGAVVHARLAAPQLSFPGGRVAGQPVRVAVTCAYDFFLPVPALVGVKQLNCGAAATMRLE